MSAVGVKWKTSPAGIHYSIYRLFPNVIYRSGSPVKNHGEAVSELALTASTWAQHQSLMNRFWSGILDMEPQIAKAMGPQKDGVLIVGLIAESEIVNPDAGVPSRLFKAIYMSDTGASYDAVMAKNAAQNRKGPSISAPKFPRPPHEMPPKGFVHNFAHIWAHR
jgi:hypothetical protein